MNSYFSPEEKVFYPIDRDGNRVQAFVKNGTFLFKQKFDKDWNLILMLSSNGSGDNQFCHVAYIALDKYDNVYVTHPQSHPGCSQNPRVLKFDSEGNFITKWGNAYMKEDGQFQDPEHLAVDSEGNVYVSDRKRDDIQKFMPVIFDKGGA